MDFHSKPNMYVSHVNLNVTNLAQSLKFYQEVIGLKVLEQTGQKVQLTADGKNALLSIERQENSVPKEKHTTGLYHFALLLPKRSDLADIIAHFMRLDIQFGASDHLVSEALYLSDPDGNGIEVYVDRAKGEWQWNKGKVAMTVDPLDFEDLLTHKSVDGWRSLPAETIIGHIHLYVSDLERAEKFYCKGLGFELVSRIGSQALFISTGKYHHHIGLNTWAGVGAPAPTENSVGLESFTLILRDEGTRNNTIEQLKAINASVEEEEGSFITYDPFGNCIHLKI